MADTQQEDQRILIDPAIARPFLLERFSDFLALEQGASPRTSEAYRRDVARLTTYVAAKGAVGPSDISSRMLREFVYHLKDLGLAPASIRRNVSSVHTYFRFLLGDGHVVRDPSERLETPKRWRSLPDVLTVGEVNRLAAAPGCPHRRRGQSAARRAQPRRASRLSRSGAPRAGLRRRVASLRVDHA